MMINDGGWKMKDGCWKMEETLKMEDRGWSADDGWWLMEDERCMSEVGRSMLDGGTRILRGRLPLGLRVRGLLGAVQLEPGVGSRAPPALGLPHLGLHVQQHEPPTMLFDSATDAHVAPLDFRDLHDVSGL